MAPATRKQIRHCHFLVDHGRITRPTKHPRSRLSSSAAYPRRSALPTSARRMDGHLSPESEDRLSTTTTHSDQRGLPMGRTVADAYAIPSHSTDHSHGDPGNN